MTVKTADRKKKSGELGAEIRENMERYEELRQYGGTDPFWPDGVNMNLCRNHIIYLRKRIEQELKPEYYPEEYYMVLPKEADPEYQATYKRDNLKKADIILKKEISVPKLREGQLTIWDFIGGQER